MTRNIPSDEPEINNLFRALRALKRFPFLHLFPIDPGDKTQPLLKAYNKRASNNPTKIKAWTAYWAAKGKGDVWWGIAPELSGLVFADVDVKPGQCGEETFQKLAKQYGGWPDTFTVQTPSGGRHHWYRGPHLFALGTPTSNHPSVDFPQYVILPGMKKADGRRYKILDKRDIADAPLWIYELAKKSASSMGEFADTMTPVIEVDQESNIEWAKKFLEQDAPRSVMFDSGNYTLLRVAQKVRDKAISYETACEIINDKYNTEEKCDPPWEGDELDTVIRNAYAYSKMPPGWDTAEFEFGPAEPEPEDERAERLAKTEARRQKREAVAEPETLASLKEGWVYIGQQKRFVRERDAMIWDTDAFNAYFSNIFVPDKSTSTPIGRHLLALQNGTGIRRFDTFCYIPGRPRNCNGNFNFYVPSSIEPVEGDTTLWDAHLEYLFPDEVDRGHVLNWLSWTVQNLGKKPKHALLIVGEKPGTGKSWIADVLTQLIGPHNTTPVDQETLERSHNGWLMRTKLIVCEEIRGLGHYNSKGAKALHNMISQERITCDEKHMAPVTLDPFLAAEFLMTNVLDAIRPDDGDRRYLIVRTLAVPKPEAYYFPLFDILEDPDALAAIMFQLMNRDLSVKSGTGYDARARAPITAAKLAMTEEASSDIEQWLLEHATNAPLCHRLVTIEEVVGALPQDMRRGGKKVRSEVRDVLRRKFGGVKHDKQIRPEGRGGDQVRVWALGASAAETLKGDLLAIWREDRPKLGSAPVNDFDE